MHAPRFAEPEMPNSSLRPRSARAEKQPARAGNSLSRPAHEQTLPGRLAPVREGFTKMPNAVLHDRQLSTGARLLYCLLRDHAGSDGECWAKEKTLGEELPASPNTITKYIEELVKRGWLEVARRGHGRVNTYKLLEVCRAPSGQAFESQNLRFKRQSGSAPLKNCGAADAKTEDGEPQKLRLVHEQDPGNKDPLNNSSRAEFAGEDDPRRVAAAIASLKEFGIESERAAELVAKAGAGEVERQVGWLPFRNLKNPAGGLITAIRRHWDAPDGRQAKHDPSKHRPAQERIDEVTAEEMPASRNQTQEGRQSGRRLFEPQPFTPAAPRGAELVCINPKTMKPWGEDGEGKQAQPGAIKRIVDTVAGWDRPPTGVSTDPDPESASIAPSPTALPAAPALALAISQNAPGPLADMLRSVVSAIPGGAAKRLLPVADSTAAVAGVGNGAISLAVPLPTSRLHPP